MLNWLSIKPQPTASKSGNHVTSVNNIVSFLSQLSDGLNAVPMTNQEKRDCSSVLSPHQIKLVDIGKCNSLLDQ